MLIEAIKYKLKSKNLEIRTNNYDDIFRLYKGNEVYAKLHGSYPTKLEKVIQDIEEIPDGIKGDQKYFLSIYNEDNELVGVLDFLDSYSYLDKQDQKSVWIGLLMIDQSKQQRGLGRLIINAFIEACKTSGKTRVQLGVIKENLGGIRFWSSVGMGAFKEVTSGKLELVLMEKPIT